MKTFKAPWPVSLHVISWVATILVVVVTTIAGRSLRHYEFIGLSLPIPAIIGPLLIIGTALFTVRAYAVTPDAILVRRLLWWTKIPRDGLKSAVADPDALTWRTIRTFGNEGCYVADESALAYSPQARRTVALIVQVERQKYCR